MPVAGHTAPSRRPGPATGLAARNRAAAERAARPRVGHLQHSVLAETAACVIPAMAAVALGSPNVAAFYFFPVLLVCLAFNTFFKNTVANVALVLAVMPVAMILRSLFLYNIILVLLVLALAGVVLRSRRQAQLLHRSKVLWLIGATVIYWSISFWLTGDYSSNLRTLELSLSAAAVLSLTKHREYIASAFLGVFISVFAIALGFLGYGDRLGFAVVNGESLGNPITFGEPLALLLLLLMTDGAKWLMLQRSTLIRIVIAGMTGVMLVLSTSRGAWLVAAGGLAMLLLFTRRGRTGIIAVLLVSAIGIGVALRTSRGGDLRSWATKTFSSERTLSNRTDGRSQQWMLAPLVVRSEPLWGFGPGMGSSVYARYSRLDPSITFQTGRQFFWHALYLQVVVECGPIGLLLLLVALALLFAADVRYWRRTHELMPLIGTLGFILIAVSVSAQDAVAGMFLGLGLFALTPIPRPVARRAAPDTEDAQPELVAPAGQLASQTLATPRVPATYWK